MILTLYNCTFLQAVGEQAKKNLKDLPNTRTKEQQKVVDDQKAAIGALLDKYNPKKPKN